jgi:hypothetical protein
MYQHRLDSSKQRYPMLDHRHQSMLGYHRHIELICETYGAYGAYCGALISFVRNLGN